MNITLTLQVQIAPLRWTSAEQLAWLQNEVPTYLQMQKEKKLFWFFELLYPKWFRSENSPDDNDANINQSSLNSDVAINEIIAKLDHENPIIPISDVEKQSNLDPELAEVLKDAIKHQCKVRILISHYTEIAGVVSKQHKRKDQTRWDFDEQSPIYNAGTVKPLVVDDIRENKLALPDQRLCAVRHHTGECFVKELEDVKDEVRVETQCINTARKLGSVTVGDD
ncbi:hypothetical protein EDB19DRAFT_1835078 [Suillus lakei]|nr:hypothetical protein EDB19DRAFT_1835078 [Suillus lakei]